MFTEKLHQLMNYKVFRMEIQNIANLLSPQKHKNFKSMGNQIEEII